MGGLRTMARCLAPVDQEVEPPLHLTDLICEEVRAVERHPHGVRLRFGSGVSIVIPAGVALDGAGNPVIEP